MSTDRTTPKPAEAFALLLQSFAEHYDDTISLTAADAAQLIADALDIVRPDDNDADAAAGIMVGSFGSIACVLREAAKLPTDGMSAPAAAAWRANARRVVWDQTMRSKNTTPAGVREIAMWRDGKCEFVALLLLTDADLAEIVKEIDQGLDQ